MATAKEESIPTREDSTSDPPVLKDTSPLTPEVVNPVVVTLEEESALETQAMAAMAAIAEDERKAAAKYGMRPKKSKIAKKRLQGGGKQYFDSGDYMMGNQPNPEILQNKTSIASISNKALTRLS